MADDNCLLHHGAGCPPDCDRGDAIVKSMAEKIAHAIEADLLRKLTDAVLADAVRPDTDGMVTMHAPTDAEAAEMDALFAEGRR